MKRVAIVGPPGSGKTTLARKIGEKLKLPIIHLDTLYHDPNFDYENDKDAWFKRSTEFIKNPKWVAEGNYSTSFKERFEAADTIIILKMSRYGSLSRILKRRIEYRKKHRTEMPEGWKEKINKEFLKYAWNFPRERTTKLDNALIPYKEKVIVLSGSQQVKDFLKRL